MHRRRWVVAGLGMITSLALATAACADDSPSSTGSNGTAAGTSAAPVDARQALIDSVKALADGNFKFTIADHESTVVGSVHQPSKSAQMEITIKDGDAEGKVGFIIVGQDRWIKMDFGSEIGELVKLPSEWMHIDPAKVTDSQTLEELTIDFSDADEIDPGGSALILGALVDVEQTGDGAYSGTVDLTKATDAGMVDEEIVTKLGDRGKAIPFTATLDGQGRLTRLTLDIPAAGDVAPYKLEVTYSDYGSAAAAQKPPADQTREAPEIAYDMLNS